MCDNHLTETYNWKSAEQVLVGALGWPDASAITEGFTPGFREVFG